MQIESAVLLLRYLHDRLQYLQPTMGSLLESACAQFSDIGWLRECRDNMRKGTPFPTAWREALTQRPGSLGQEEQELLLPLGGVLGTTDLENQLSTLAYTCQQMEHQLALAQKEKEKHQKLYRTLGVLAGIAIAILLI